MSSRVPRQTQPRPPGRAQTEDFTRIPRPRERDHNFQANTEEVKSSEGSKAFYPILLAVLPPTCSFFFGMDDFWSDTFLLILVLYYMHTLIQTPWDMYHASRSRRLANPLDIVTLGTEEPDAAAIEALRYEAQVQLQRQEMLTFFLVLIAPLIGGWLFVQARGRLKALNAFISDFNILLFVLTAEVRPLSHLANIVQGRAKELQERVHHPTSAIEAVGRRLALLENEFKQLKKAYATKQDVGMLKDSLEPSIQQLSKMLIYQQKHEAGEINRLEKLIKNLNQEFSELKDLTIISQSSSDILSISEEDGQITSAKNLHLQDSLSQKDIWLEEQPLSIRRAAQRLPVLAFQICLLPVTYPLSYLGSVAEGYLPTNPSRRVLQNNLSVCSDEHPK